MCFYNAKNTSILQYYAYELCVFLIFFHIHNMLLYLTYDYIIYEDEPGCCWRMCYLNLILALSSFLKPSKPMYEIHYQFMANAN